MIKGIIRTLSFLIFIVFVVLYLSAPSGAGEPTDQVKQTVDAVLEVLRNKELKKPEKTEQRRASIRAIVDERFDFEEMAKRSLAQHWRRRTPEERKEFVSLFTDLLENAYIRKIEKYEDEKILYGEERIEGDYATLKTQVVTRKEVRIPIEYRLLRKGVKWEVYDVVIEGVSLVNNYRNQFNSILSSGTYEELVRRIKNKTLKEPA